MAHEASSDGRRRRRLAGGRRHQVKVRLSDEELARVQLRAGEMGLSTPSYLAEIGQAARPAALPDPTNGAQPPPAGSGVRLVAERGRPLSVLERRTLAAELFGVHRLLIGVATNLNQLAKVANSTGHVPPQVAAAAAAVSRYLPRLKAVVAALDPHGGR